MEAFYDWPFWKNLQKRNVTSAEITSLLFALFPYWEWVPISGISFLLKFMTPLIATTELLHVRSTTNSFGKYFGVHYEPVSLH